MKTNKKRRITSSDNATPRLPKTLRRKGFTIVELLIVIVVIGILAAITIVAYTGIQGRAQMSAKSVAISKIKKAYKLYSIDNGDFPEIAMTNPNAAAELANIGLNDEEMIYIEGQFSGEYKKDYVILSSGIDYMQVIYWDNIDRRWKGEGWWDAENWYSYTNDLGSGAQPAW